MFILYLLLGFTSLCAALPRVEVKYGSENEFDIKRARQYERLLRFSIYNNDSSAFSLKMEFTNKCYFKRLNRPSNFSLPLTELGIRITKPYFSEYKNIWYRRSPIICDYFIVNFAKEDIKKYYEIELLGSWDDGGHILAPGTYGEPVKLTILPLQTSN